MSEPNTLVIFAKSETEMVIRYTYPADTSREQRQQWCKATAGAIRTSMPDLTVDDSALEEGN